MTAMPVAPAGATDATAGNEASATIPTNTRAWNFMTVIPVRFDGSLATAESPFLDCSDNNWDYADKNWDYGDKHRSVFDQSSRNEVRRPKERSSPQGFW